jgi:predicted PurR-regulated permease PerM
MSVLDPSSLLSGSGTGSGSASAAAGPTSAHPLLSVEGSPLVGPEGGAAGGVSPISRPESLNNLIVTGVIAVSILAALALVAFLSWARAMLIPVVLGLSLAYVLAPVAALLRRWLGLGHGAAVATVIVGALMLSGGLGWLVWGEVVSFAGRSGEYREKIGELVCSMMAPMRTLQQTTDTLMPAAGDRPEGGPAAPAAPPPAAPPPAAGPLPPVPVPVGPTAYGPPTPTQRRAGAFGPAPGSPHETRSDAADAAATAAAVPLGVPGRPMEVRIARDDSELLPELFSYAGGLATLLEEIAIVIFVGIFALSGWPMFREKLLALAGRNRFDIALKVLGGIDEGIQGYLWGSFLVALIVGVGTTALLFPFGVPYLYLWGLLAGILAFVPYVGVPFAIIPPLLVAYLNGTGLGEIALIAAIYIVFRTIEGQYIYALLMGRHIDMNPLAVLVSLIFWGWVWGPVGLIIGVPLTMVVIVICDQLPGFAFVGELLGGEGHSRASAIVTPDSPAANLPPDPTQTDRPLVTRMG